MNRNQYSSSKSNGYRYSTHLYILLLITKCPIILNLYVMSMHLFLSCIWEIYERCVEAEHTKEVGHTNHKEHWILQKTKVHHLAECSSHGFRKARTGSWEEKDNMKRSCTGGCLMHFHYCIIILHYNYYCHFNKNKEMMIIALVTRGVMA